MEVSGLEAVEKAAEGFGGAGEAADDEAVDDEFIDEMDDGCEEVLAVADDFGVELIEVEFVAEDLEEGFFFEGVFFFSEVEDVGESGSDDDGEEGDGEGEVHVKTVVFVERREVFCDGGESGEDGKKREDEEGDKHEGAHFLGMVGVIASCFSKEDDEEKAAHIEGGEEGDEAGDDEEDDVVIAGSLEDLFLGPEAGGDEGEAAEGGGTDQEGDGGDGHFFPEAAHFPDVLLVVAGVDDGTGAEEEEGLEPGVGEEVEHAGFAREEADGHDHVAELGEGGVGENFFDVILLGGHEGGEECGDAADPGDGAGREGELGFEWIEADEEASHHVNTGGDHGGGVDEGGDGGGAFHGVGQPDVEGSLGGFTHGSGKEAEDGDAEEGGGDLGVGGGPGGDAIEGEGGSGASGDLPEEEDADHEAEVANAVGEEGFFWRRLRRSFYDTNDR